ncbi:bifunctional riboflavin kinase/FAD synthetase [Ornithinibacillus halotolerans]|uniref:Riboflavin biosynthesis protein n=1 Tax=Ornithinibacillus halotolerans TaxID=1274357 RepID=A0A916RQP1_9BACI|nr:bifunctional riboflavin kinase/FAD synthetase [Ornithinibacillus halotolerans]GGA62666.1 riboflavin biosynthesis protein [Ornithinibacillus halotolerans]
METIELTYPHQLNRDEMPNTVAAIGFFDGIHKGHQTVIQTAIKLAETKNMESAVITFYPHPSVVLRNNQEVKYITPPHDKQVVLEELGVDRLYIINFNKQLSTLTPEHFLEHFIVGLNIHHIVAGFDYTYGHKGKGNMETIKEHAKGKFDYTVIDKVILDGEKVSSTKIRSLLDIGDIEQVNELLGRVFTTSGTVVSGFKRGRELGYPTANIQYNNVAHLPKAGIYAVQVIIDGNLYRGMASLGVNPTFSDERSNLSLEVYIFDFNQDIYGKEIIVEWYNFIRNEEKFDNVEALIQQMDQDEKDIRRIFSSMQ